MPLEIIHRRIFALAMQPATLLPTFRLPNDFTPCTPVMNFLHLVTN